ncbi:hypothetical protein GCM10009639_32980 [Kitasatospora putterlickiae]|uniref:Integral membrane protein n=1 Tax=Kitasatospora putterlickiae TaxID=221725 RepID=A0ABN1Y317_9ACTN
MSDQNWPGLGFCPAPGDLGAIAQMYTDVDAVARELEELRRSLAGIGTTGGAWEGEAARAFAEKLGELPKYLDKGHRSMAACSLALKTWHTQLSGMVTAGQGMETEAAELRRRLEWQDKQAADLGRSLDALVQPGAQAPAADVLERTQARFEAARESSLRGHRQLDEVIARARKQLDDHRQKAETAARAVQEASRNHPPDPNVFKRLLDGVQHAWQKSIDFLVDHADLLSEISASLAIAALTISWVPVIGQVGGIALGGAAMLTSAGALIGHGIGKSRGKDVSWLDIGVDSLGVFPGIGAIKGFATAGKEVKVAKNLSLVQKVPAFAKEYSGAIRGSAGAGLRARTAGSGKALFEMTSNPLSTKGITAGLKKFGVIPEPRNVTLPVKAFGMELGLLDHKGPNADLEQEPAQPVAPPSASPFLHAVAT